MSQLLEGISKVGEIVDLGVKAGVVEKSGAWYSYGDERIGQGRENAKLFLKENISVSNEIEEKIKTANGLDLELLEETPEQAQTIRDSSDDSVLES